MTKLKGDILLVPTDFTPVADCAIDHAIEIAKLFELKICLLHIVRKNVSLSTRKEVETKLMRISAGFTKSSGINISYKVQEGSIFDEISKTADTIKAEFIVMGIHGRQGVQHLLGSYAYKVISSTNVPVIVVKNRHHHEGYNNIVVPVDLNFDSTKTVNNAIKFAKLFNSVVHVIGVLQSGSSVTRINKKVLIKKISDCITSKSVKVKAEILLKRNSEVSEKVLEYADSIEADLVMIVAEKGGSFSGLFGRNYAEQIIDKAEMPVLAIVPTDNYDDEIDVYGFQSFIDPLGLIDKTG